MLSAAQNRVVFFITILTIVMAVPALAHFQVIYTPKSALTPEDPSKVNLLLVFTHPFEAGHTMSMGLDAAGKIHPPKMFGLIQKGQKTDLLDKLKPIEFTSLTNKGRGYELNGLRLKGMGDFIFYLDPGPYYEKAEDAYIQQCTKIIVNRGGAPTNWNEPAGLPVEILPLDKPYALWTDNVFRGVVVRKEGDKYVPVPGAEIEVEYMNHAIKGHAFEKKAAVKAPQDAFVTQTILADDKGQFTYALPRAGWWGFCALGAGGDVKHDGKELSLDAVIWVQPQDMK
jgi:cobalt/nickel transport protein